MFAIVSPQIDSIGEQAKASGVSLSFAVWFPFTLDISKQQQHPQFGRYIRRYRPSATPTVGVGLQSDARNQIQHRIDSP